MGYCWLYLLVMVLSYSVMESAKGNVIFNQDWHILGVFLFEIKKCSWLCCCCTILLDFQFQWILHLFLLGYSFIFLLYSISMSLVSNQINLQYQLKQKQRAARQPLSVWSNLHQMWSPHELHVLSLDLIVYGCTDGRPSYCLLHINPASGSLFLQESHCVRRSAYKDGY